MKKGLSILLCGILGLSLTAPAASEAGIPVEAADMTASEAASSEAGSANEASPENMTQVLTLVKEKITVPDELTQFDYQFYSGSAGEPASWYFSWRDEEYQSRMTVYCDSSGHITSYSYRPGTSSPYVPVYLKTELKGRADAFLAAAAPEILTSLEYAGCSSGGVWNGTYTYRYTRVENHIPMPENTVSVTVNFETGTVVGFESSWLYDATIPEALSALTREEAAGLIADNASMQLSYRRRMNEDGTAEAYLVYTPTVSYIAVDAKTGEVYLTKNEWLSSSAAESADSAANTEESAADGGVVLTEEEQKRIEELAGLITASEAVRSVTSRSELLLGGNLSSVTTSLSNSGTQEDPAYVWNISFSDPAAQSGYRSSTGLSVYANASVDAHTGRLLSFYAEPGDYYDLETGEWQSVTVHYTLEEAQAVLEAFLRSELPDYYEQTVFSSSGTDYIASFEQNQPVYGGYSYRYNRINESIEYTYDYLCGSVDGITGKIYSYSYHWDDNLTFESPADAISEQEAMEAYLALDGYGLVYEIHSVHSLDEDSQDAYSVHNEIRLVYTPDISPAIISPFTGKQLNYDGSEYTPSAEAYEYNDITGHPAVRSIRLLADIGIGFPGGSYQPEKAVTEEEFLSTLSSLFFYEPLNSNPQNTSICRETAIRAVISALGLEKVASLDGIYQADFTDAEQFPAGFTGYAALAQGLGLTKVFGDALSPERLLTRGEMAGLLIQTLKANAALNR